MDYLREGIHLRGFAQIDPLVAYKNEGFTMFRELMNSIWEEFTRIIFHVEVTIEPAGAGAPLGEEAPAPAEMQYSGGGPEQPSAMRQAAGAAQGVPGVTGGAHPGVAGGGAAAPGAAVARGADETNPATVVKGDREKIGRNDPCWCGSGKKYKKCHGA
jgi:preprotein translocase subunit SecA